MARAKETADEPLALLAKIRGIQQEVTKHNTVYEPIISKEELTMYVATCINSCRKSPNDSLKIILREITEIRGGVYVYPPVEQVAAHLVDFIQKSAPQESTPVGIGSKIHSLTNAVSRADNTRYVNTLPEKKSFCEYLLRGKQCQNYPDCEGKHADFCMAHLDGKCLQGEQCELVHIDAGTGCGRRATKSAVSQVPGRFQRAERDRQERWARPTAMKETPCPRLVTAGTCRFDAAKCWYSTSTVWYRQQSAKESRMESFPRRTRKLLRTQEASVSWSLVGKEAVEMERAREKVPKGQRRKRRRRRRQKCEEPPRAIVTCNRSAN